MPPLVGLVGPLPLAPLYYSKEDQDRTRRVIEQALAAQGFASLASVGLLFTNEFVQTLVGSSTRVSLATVQPNAHTWSALQTFPAAPTSDSIAWGGLSPSTTFSRLQSGVGTDTYVWAVNHNRTTNTQDDAAKPSWRQTFNLGNDTWSVARAPAGSVTFAAIVTASLVALTSSIPLTLGTNALPWSTLFVGTAAPGANFPGTQTNLAAQLFGTALNSASSFVGTQSYVSVAFSLPTFVAGLQGQVYAAPASGTLVNASGTVGAVEVGGAGIVAVAQGLVANVFSTGTGTITSAKSITVDGPDVFGSGSITNAYQLFTDDMDFGTNRYNAFLGGVVAGGTPPTNGYGLWIDPVSGASGINRAIKTNAGIVEFGDQVFLKMGAAAATSTALGEFDCQTGSVGNINAGATDLMSKSLLASALTITKRGIRIHAWGTFANNANAKTLTFAFGATSITLVAATTGGNSAWVVDLRVIRTGLNTQDIHVVRVANAAPTAVVTFNAAATETESGAIPFKFTATGVASNDIVQRGMDSDYADGS